MLQGPFNVLLVLHLFIFLAQLETLLSERLVLFWDNRRWATTLRAWQTCRSGHLQSSQPTTSLTLFVPVVVTWWNAWSIAILLPTQRQIGPATAIAWCTDIWSDPLFRKKPMPFTSKLEPRPKSSLGLNCGLSDQHCVCANPGSHFHSPTNADTVWWRGLSWCCWSPRWLTFRWSCSVLICES